MRRKLRRDTPSQNRRDEPGREITPHCWTSPHPLHKTLIEVKWKFPL